MGVSCGSGSVAICGHRLSIGTMNFEPDDLEPYFEVIKI